MCGRNSVFAPQPDLEYRFDAKVAGDYQPRYNIAPSEPTEVVTNESQDVIDQFRWGLVPSWAENPDRGLINARSETAHEKPSFRDAWAKRPCLVPSSGFYEWKASGGAKEPYRIYRKDDEVFAFAGLWEEWTSDGGDSLRTVTILTTEPNETVSPIHNRMPVILPEDEEDRWLNADAEERMDLCRPYPSDDLDAYTISTRVNDPSNDDARVIEPLGNEQSGLGEFA